MAAIETLITHVAVYTDRARITRQGTTHLAPGEHKLSIAGIPETLQDDSVRASGRGANVRILGVDVVREFVTEAPEDDLAALQKDLEGLQDRDKALADDDALLASQSDYLHKLRENGSHALPRGVAYGKTDLESITALSDYVSNELAQIQAARREIGLERRQLAREIAALQGRLQPRYRGNERREIAVSVEATEETDLQLEIVYGVLNASWEPLYDVRLNENRVGLTYLANVRQSTGENWDNVRLSLSTARPAVNTTIPELHPWFLDVYRPMPKLAPSAPMMARSVAAPTGAAESMMVMDEGRFESAPVAQVMEAEVESAGASVTFNVPRTLSVPSDGTPHKTTVTTLDLDAKLDYVTVPKLAEEAYLRAKIRNNTAVVLLAGSANIFHEENFVGKTFLETVVPNEEFEAQLGVDDRVKVKRELSERTASKAFIGNTRRSGLGYKITVSSHLDWPTRVTIYDQAPVSRHESIKVKLHDVVPEPTEQTDLNILCWDLPLQPQGKAEVRYGFTVENPRDIQVAGMSE